MAGQIGSVKGPKNFGSNQTVFHRDDVPAARRERKKEVSEVSSHVMRIIKAACRAAVSILRRPVPSESRFAHNGAQHIDERELAGVLPLVVAAVRASDDTEKLNMQQ